MDNLTLSEIQRLDKAYNESHPMLLGTKLQAIIDAINAGIGPDGQEGPAGPAGPAGPCTEILEATPTNGVSANETLSISSVVINGETVGINNPEVVGEDVYEFVSSTALIVSGEGYIPVDINTYTVKATGVLTVDTNPTSGEKITIGEKVYTFVPSGTANYDGEIGIGDSVADTQVNIVDAILGEDLHNEPHPLVTCGSAFSSDDLTITAKFGGVAGNSIVTTSNMVGGNNGFALGVLDSGEDCTAANAVTALVAAITASDTQGVGAAAGANNTVVLTADIGGVITNTIAIAEDMANGAFTNDAVSLSGGEDATPGLKGSIFMDSNYIYLCIADNDVTGKNWRRIALGNAF